MIEPRYTRPARQDYLDVAAYISRDNPVAAARTVDRIEQECLRLTQHPEVGIRHDELPKDVLIRPVGRYLIVYRIDEQGPLILRIVHGARDLGRLFPESD